jgi:phage terminase large subunit-like protein
MTEISDTLLKPLPEHLQEAIPSPLNIARELNNRSLYHFLEYFWPVYSSQPFSPNWHIKYLCGELEKVAEKVSRREPRDYDLIINVPPGSTKTALVSIMFPIWCWTKWHWMLVIAMSYSDKLSLESAEYCRDILRSQLFQEMYPDIIIKEDKDVKSNFKIAKKVVGMGGPHRRGSQLTGGGRLSTSLTGSVTGFHGDLLIVDDPLNPNQAASDVELANANHFMEQTLPLRKRDKDVTPVILIMQRLAQNDPSGHWLSKEEVNVRHICLPGEIRNFREFVKPPELVEFYTDELLDTKRISWKTLTDLKSKLGQYGYAGQVGQNPVPPGGGMFHVDSFIMINTLPSLNQVVSTVRYWDKAGTSGGGAYTVGVKMTRLTYNRWVIEDMKRGQWGSNERERIIRQTAEADGTGVEIWIEQEPGPIWEEELIQMRDGTQLRLKDIKKGDLIINGFGDPVIVKQVHIQGELESLKITTDSGRIIHSSLEHSFFTPEGWITAERLKVGDVLALRSHVNVGIQKDPTIEECRMAGYFVGDGCCTFTRGSEKSCNASIVSSDRSEGLDIIYCAESLGFHVHLGGSKGWTYYLSDGSRDWLKARGMAGKNTLTKTVPDWVIKAGDECVANFLGAYFACDGSASATSQHPYIDYYSTNIELLKQVQSLLLRFGIYTMLRKRTWKESYQIKRHTGYRLIMRRSDGSMGRFAKMIPVYGVKSLKIAEFKQINFNQDYLPDEIMSIEKIGKLPCRCLTVSEGESFLVNDIVVHNSGGLESAQGTIRNLAGFTCRAERPTGDKASRADPYSVQVNNGAFMILNAMWNHDFIEEHRFFPFSTNKDIVDASSGAFNRLISKKLAGRIT